MSHADLIDDVLSVRDDGVLRIGFYTLALGQNLAPAQIAGLIMVRLSRLSRTMSKPIRPTPLCASQAP